MKTQQTTNFAAMAEYYYDLGYLPLPTVYTQKHPYISYKGFHEDRNFMSRDELLSKFSSATGIALVTGRSGNCFIVDADTEEAIKFMEDNHFDEAAMVIVKTRKGFHYYYAFTESLSDISNSADKLKDHFSIKGFDIRTTGGIVIAPPTPHSSGSCSYTVVKGGIMEETITCAPTTAITVKASELLPVPEGLVTIIREAKNKSDSTSNQPSSPVNAKLLSEVTRTIPYILKSVREASSGSRNMALNIAAYTVGKYYSAKTIEKKGIADKLIAAATDSGLVHDDGLAAVKATINSGIEAGSVKYSRKIAMDLIKQPLIETADYVVEHLDGFKILDYTRILKYKNGYWATTDKRDLVYAIQRLADKFSIDNDITVVSSASRGVIDRVLIDPKLNINSENLSNNKHKLVLKDGTYDLKNRKFEAHSKEDYALNGLEHVSFNPKAECPTWHRCMKEWFNGDKISYVKARRFFAYSLVNSAALHKALWLYGEPGSGKSTFIYVLSRLFKGSVAKVGMRDLDSNFGLSSVIGKKLIVSEENSAEYIDATDRLNTLIDGGTLHIDIKYKDPIEYNNAAKLVWAMNTLPRFKADEQGIYRRLILLKFNRVSQKDPTIYDKLDEEMDGILQWALTGLDEILDSEGRLIPGTLDFDDYDTLVEMVLESDPTKAFIQEALMLIDAEQANKVPFTSVYEAYTQWCKNNGYKAVSSRRFNNKLREAGFIGLRSNAGMLWTNLSVTLRQPFTNTGY